MANDPSLYNPDLASIPPERRTWGPYDYAWFVGIALAAGLYLALMQRSPAAVKWPGWEGEG